jgi:hypothetical protein
MANIFWIISLAATTICIVCLLLFALPLSNKNTEKLARFLYKAKNVLFFFIFVYAIVVYQEYVNLNKRVEEREAAQNQVVADSRIINEFKAKRNYFLTLCGFAATIGLYIVISVSMVWGKKNRKLREKINVRATGN